MTQKAVIVRTGPEGHDGLEELNIELERGWTVAEVCAMGGADTSAAAVAALEEIGDEAEEVVEQVIEEAEEVVEDNGADPFEN